VSEGGEKQDAVEMLKTIQRMDGRREAGDVRRGARGRARARARGGGECGKGARTRALAMYVRAGGRACVCVVGVQHVASERGWTWVGRWSGGKQREARGGEGGFSGACGLL
jgi:hypothetical protein